MIQKSSQKWPRMGGPGKYPKMTPKWRRPHPTHERIQGPFWGPFGLRFLSVFAAIFRGCSLRVLGRPRATLDPIWTPFWLHLASLLSLFSETLRKAETVLPLKREHNLEGSGDPQNRPNSALGSEVSPGRVPGHLWSPLKSIYVDFGSPRGPFLET